MSSDMLGFLLDFLEPEGSVVFCFAWPPSLWNPAVFLPMKKGGGRE